MSTEHTQESPETTPLTVAVIGSEGAMGQLVARLSEEHGFTVVPIDVDGKQLHEYDMAGDIAVAIDFSSPRGCLEAAQWCADNGVPFVSGTTGLTPLQVTSLRGHASAIPVLHSANFSLGIAALRRAVRFVASMLESWDAEVIDIHHNRKVDAPSGTALTLGRDIAEARHLDFNQVARLYRDANTGKRKKDEIGFESLRVGGVVGKHTVIFASDEECIELVHRANNREIFAAGALHAAQWIVGKEPGLYTIDDILSDKFL